MRIASGLTRPLFLTAPPGDAEHLFVVEQFSGTTGRIRIIKDGILLATPFLSISPVSTGNEQGLLYDIDEHGYIVLRVPGEMQVDFRIDIARHGVLLGPKGQEEKPVETGFLHQMRRLSNLRPRTSPQWTGL